MKKSSLWPSTVPLASLRRALQAIDWNETSVEINMITFEDCIYAEHLHGILMKSFI